MSNLPANINAIKHQQAASLWLERIVQFESDLLFKVLSERSERTSTIVTTNLPFSKWTDLFENTTMVTASVDRLTYRSHVLDMNGPSYRLLATQGGSNVD